MPMTIKMVQSLKQSNEIDAGVMCIKPTCVSISFWQHVIYISQIQSSERTWTIYGHRRHVDGFFYKILHIVGQIWYHLQFTFA